jgi:hypothetical protein
MSSPRHILDPAHTARPCVRMLRVSAKRFRMAMRSMNSPSKWKSGPPYAIVATICVSMPEKRSSRRSSISAYVSDSSTRGPHAVMFACRPTRPRKSDAAMIRPYEPK